MMWAWRTAMMQLETHPIRSRKAFVGDTYSSGSHIYPEDWDCIRQICPCPDSTSCCLDIL